MNDDIHEYAPTERVISEIDKVFLDILQNFAKIDIGKKI